MVERGVISTAATYGEDSSAKLLCLHQKDKIFMENKDRGVISNVKHLCCHEEEKYINENNQ